MDTGKVVEGEFHIQRMQMVLYEERGETSSLTTQERTIIEVF